MARNNRAARPCNALSPRSKHSDGMKPSSPRTGRRHRTRRDAKRRPTVSGASYARFFIPLATTFVAVALVVYALRLDHVVGFYIDDAWYIVLAKAIASGQGFTLVNAPQPGIMAIYPPGFPAILSLAFRLLPHEFEALWLLKILSILAMAGVGILSFCHFRLQRGLPRISALVLCAATVLSPAFVFLATSTVMSECVFTALQMATVLAAEGLTRGPEGRRWPLAVLTAVLASAAFLVRSMALGLLVSVPLYLLTKGRMRLAIVFAAGVTACVAPWMLYASSHEPTAHEQAIVNDFVVYGYSTQFWYRLAGYPTLGTISAGELPRRVIDNAAAILTSDVGALEVYPLYRAIEPTETKGPDDLLVALSLVLSALTLLGFVTVARGRMTQAEWLVLLTVALTLAWPFSPLRFLLPLLPFFLFYLHEGMGRLGALFRRGHEIGRSGRGTLGLLAIVTIVISDLAAHVSYIAALHGTATARPAWVRAFEENLATMHWAAESLPTGSVLASQNPALLYLATGHPTVSSWEPGDDWARWRQSGTQYWVDVWPFPSPVRLPALYQSPAMNLRVVRIAGTPEEFVWWWLP
jgi:hypothetical protein